MLTAMRRQVQACLASVPCRRRPALRRTDNPDFLLMTNLPQAASPQDVAAFAQALRHLGWRVEEIPGWLLLDGPIPVPACPAPASYPGEAGCCAWLLQHHPGGDAPLDMLRALVKAAEQGAPQVEKLCRAWHGQLAAMLRRHQPLPGGLLPYLCAAMKEVQA